MSDYHFPDDKLGKWQCGFEGDGERAARSGDQLITFWPILLTFFLNIMRLLIGILAI